MVEGWGGGGGSVFMFKCIFLFEIFWKKYWFWSGIFNYVRKVFCENFFFFYVDR